MPLRFNKKSEDIVLQAVQDGVFEIDRFGRIWRLQIRKPRGKIGTGLMIDVACRRRRAETNIHGYKVVRLNRNLVIHTAQAHRLVWRWFKGDIPKGLTINHINSDPSDNRLVNLELASMSEQNQHAMLFGRWTPLKGEDNGMSKLTRQNVIKIRRMYSAKIDGLVGLARRFGIDHGTAGRIIRGTSWSHVGGPISRKNTDRTPYYYVKQMAKRD